MIDHAFLPIYKQIAKHLRENILAGVYPAGNKIPSERALAKRFGINRLTVNKALKLLESQSLVTRSRGRGTFVSFRQNVGRKARRVWMWGVTPAADENYYMSQLFGSMQHAFSGQGIEMVFLDHYDRLVERFHECHIDGLIIFSPKTDPLETMGISNLASIPHVIIAGSDVAFAAPGFIVVDVDNAAAVREMTMHLLDLGHKSIAFLGGNPSNFHSHIRQKTFHDTLKQRGISSTHAPELMISDCTQFMVESYAFSRDLLIDRPDVSAIYATGLAQIKGAMKAIREAGKEVPRDISLVGFDDSPSLRFDFPDLMTSRQPVREMGNVAARMLLEQLNVGSITTSKQMLSAEMIFGGSCGPVRVLL